ILEGALGAAFFIEIRHPLEICLSRRTSVGASHQRAENFLCAGFFLAWISGTAREHLADAARVPRTHGVEGPLNSQKADGRIILQLRNAVVLERFSLILPDLVQHGSIVGCNERSPYRMRSRLYRNHD